MFEPGVSEQDLDAFNYRLKLITTNKEILKNRIEWLLKNTNLGLEYFVPDLDLNQPPLRDIGKGKYSSKLLIFLFLYTDLAITKFTKCFISKIFKK